MNHIHNYGKNKYTDKGVVSSPTELKNINFHKDITDLWNMITCMEGKGLTSRTFRSSSTDDGGSLRSLFPTSSSSFSKEPILTETSEAYVAEFHSNSDHCQNLEVRGGIINIFSWTSICRQRLNFTQTQKTQNLEIVWRPEDKCTKNRSSGELK